jgi:hypothetical protein
VLVAELVEERDESSGALLEAVKDAMSAESWGLRLAGVTGVVSVDSSGAPSGTVWDLHWAALTARVSVAELVAVWAQ